MPPLPLKGRVVVELSQFIAGPTAAQLLADFGATVIKIEPVKGDGSRALSGTEHGSAYFRCFNTNKQSRILDMREEDGRRQLFDLLDGADALVCNLAPSGLSKLGLDPASLPRRFPRLVGAYISGFGQQDTRTCMDTIAQCESGFAWMNGNLDGTPRVSTSWPVDFYSGLYAAMATAMALLDPAREEGTIIDLTMMEVASAVLLGPAAILAAEGGPIGQPTGNRDRASAPSGIYECADGHIYIYGGLDNYWAALREEIGGRDASFAERLAQAEEFDGIVEKWTRTRSPTEALETLARLRVPAGKVRTPQEALQVIRSFRRDAAVKQTGAGEAVPMFPALFDGERIVRRPAPKFGSHEMEES